MSVCSKLVKNGIHSSILRVYDFIWFWVHSRCLWKCLREAILFAMPWNVLFWLLMLFTSFLFNFMIKSEFKWWWEVKINYIKGYLEFKNYKRVILILLCYWSVLMYVLVLVCCWFGCLVSTSWWAEYIFDVLNLMLSY